ncbi:MAG: glutathione S-transferase family protein [Acidisphaera sp.]|nr:glutathione S-transferase family protein [Acidisphaera sp.]MBV9813228.1 glutathione S-transferase family protein [Acetobacteraceae bacterium]
MIKLWGRSTSSNVMKVIWLLEELRLPYERVDVGGAFGGTSTPEYRAMQPLGLVPALQDGDLSLFESNAILRYLCNAHAPDSPLFPAASHARATVDSWMDFQQTALNRPQGVVFQGLIRTAPEQRDQAAIARAVEEASEIWGILDARLAKQAYVTGAAFSIADIPWGVHAHRWLNMEFARKPFAHLQAWYERLLQRPPYKAHCAGKIA